MSWFRGSRHQVCEDIHLLSQIITNKSIHKTGKWLFQYTPERQAEIDEIDDWDMEICHPENGWLTRQLMDLDAFHRLFVSIGYAVQRMPRLSRIRVFGDFAFENAFDFFCERSTGTFTARWLSESSYEPNQQVASAWKFRLEDMEVVIEDEAMVILNLQ